MRAFGLLVAFTVVGPVAAQSLTEFEGRPGFVITGRAQVVDADTLRVDGAPKDVRLFGIDAPEKLQPCVDATGARVLCGVRAAEELAAILGRNPRVTCVLRDVDRYGRLVSTCTCAGVDISAEMVRRGWAVDLPRYSDGRYETQEDAAREARSGLWGYRDFEIPWEWRARQRQSPGRLR